MIKNHREANLKNLGFYENLRYLQTLNSIAAEHNSTIIFPMPINLVQAGKSLFTPNSAS